MTLSRRISLVASVIIAVTTVLFAALSAYSSRSGELRLVDTRLTELRKASLEAVDPVTALLESSEATSTNFLASLIVTDEPPISLLDVARTPFEIPAISDEQLFGAQFEALTVTAGTPLRLVSLDLGDEQWMVFGEDVGEIEDRFRVQLLSNFLFALLLTLVGGALASYIARRSLRPIGLIAEYSREIAAGRLEAALDMDASTLEVRELQRAITGMVGSLRDAADTKSRSEAAMREFLADVAHELRTPLTTLRAYSDLLTSGAASDAETMARAQSRIAQESKRMTRLIDDLLLLARVSSTTADSTESVDVSDLIRTHLEDLRILDPHRSLSIAGGNIVIEANRGLLERMIVNIVSNIHRHTPSTAPVEVRIDADNGGATLTFDDGGPGLSHAQLQQLADGVQRFGLSRADDRHGTGLGLHLLTSIVRSHGGEVRFEKSHLGGLRLKIWLPGVQSGSHRTNNESLNRTDA